MPSSIPIVCPYCGVGCNLDLAVIPSCNSSTGYISKILTYILPLFS